MHAKCHTLGSNPVTAEPRENAGNGLALISVLCDSPSAESDFRSFALHVSAESIHSGVHLRVIIRGVTTERVEGIHAANLNSTLKPR
jgi:hypothetical protein